MGRRSIAETIMEEIKEIDAPEAVYIVAYDFTGTTPSTRFYENLHRIADGESSLVQYSVFMTRSLKTAISVADLAEHYGA